MGLFNYMQDPRAMPFDVSSMSTEAAEPYTGNEPRLPPLRMQAPMPSFMDVMGSGMPTGPGSGINPAAMQFISQMASQPGAGLMANAPTYGTPWQYGTPVGMPSLFGREAVLGPGATPIQPGPPPGSSAQAEEIERVLRQGSER